MTVYPFAAVFILCWLWVISRSADKGVTFVIAVIPFGMFAVISLAGLSLILANFLVMLTILALLVRWLTFRSASLDVTLPTAGNYLVFFAVYSLFSAFILVRIFQGDFLVFPMNLSSATIQVSVSYPSTMWLLQPTTSNISQSFYILLSCGFFIAAVFTARRGSIRIIETGLVWAGAVNILLGVLDFLALDTFLALIRTADYSLANQQSLGGFARVIGGFSEASAFGATSAALTAYFAMSALMGRRSRDAGLAFGNLLCTIFAFSTTGTLALAAAGLLMLFHARHFLTTTLTRVFGHMLVILTAGLVVVMCLVILLSPTLDLLSDLVERLVLSKRNSLSGIERRAWAHAAFIAFSQTWGLGAGAGSLRGNGLISVLMGSVGLPGVLAFSGFLYHAIGKPVRHHDSETYRTFYASRICALTLLCSMLLSATSADPTLLLMAVTALAVVSREVSREEFPSEAATPVSGLGSIST